MRRNDKADSGLSCGRTILLSENRPVRDLTALARVRAVEPRLPPGTSTGTELRILLESMRLFAHHGYRATSVRTIATAVGIKAPSLYEHFPAKEDILARIVLIGHRALLTACERALADCGPDPVSQVRELVRTHVLNHVSYPLLAIVTNDELHHLSPARAAEALTLRERTEHIAIEAGRRGVDQGLFDGTELVATTAAISSMGVRAPYWFTPTPEYGPADLANAYAELAVRMLRPGSPRGHADRGA
ncbi:TetR/AcrR family transcriptional regulator [Amycolatopsis aidingensis]|uniref:TetR/AcrR family transcriptional regulator n=1 Tax=Amycolatopsis aidingensis TaxID=2842453 RepID=UPI001C0C5605|nr:TetR/AcrR family transcriptional regulator [Amycolatopsis aidingensis]